MMPDFKKNLIKIIILAVVFLTVCIIVFLAVRKSDQANQRTFFSQFIISGGSIVWFVFLPLSVITISLSIDYFTTIRTAVLLPPHCGAEIIKIIRDKDWQKLLKTLPEKKDLVSPAVFAAVRNQPADRRQIQHQLQMQNTVSDIIKQQYRQLARKIEWLSIIGNISPMIGLFGTVYGMIKLFNSIVIASGQPRPEQMADGISIALVTTFWGLLIAIPALVVHSIFSNRIDFLAQQAAIQAEVILVEIKNSIENRPVSESAERPDEA